MRLSLLCLLAVVGSAYSYAISYPYGTELKLALGRGYLHYYDAKGVEHLLNYDYPDPLYYVRALGSSIFSAPATTYVPNESLYTEQELKARYEHFRMWIDKRYAALRAEMDRLNSKGEMISSDLLAQCEILRNIIKTPGYIDKNLPEMKRLLDEHLLIWQEARLRVSQWESDRIYGQGKKQIDGKQFVNIGETTEQKKAREEHFRIYNQQIAHTKKVETEHLSKVQSKSGVAGIVPITKSLEHGTEIIHQSVVDGHGLTKAAVVEQHLVQPQVVQDTPEVARARQEHLRVVDEVKKTYKETETPVLKAKVIPQLRIGVESVPIQQHAVKTSSEFIQYTPEVLRAREEHFRLFKNVATVDTTVPQTHDVQQVEGGVESDIERVREFERLRAEKSFLEEEERLRLQEDERQRLADNLIEEKRIKEEQRFMEMERLRLQAEEQQRLKLDQMTEIQDGLMPTEQLQGVQQLSPNLATRSETTVPQVILLDSQPQQQRQPIQVKSYETNPFLYNTNVQPGKFVLTGIPAGSRVINLQSPLVIRYGADGQPQYYTEGGAKYTDITSTVAVPEASVKTIQYTDNDLTTRVAGHSGNVYALSELEKATREHFRAHEIALEQLRLANIKSGEFPNKDCN